MLAIYSTTPTTLLLADRAHSYGDKNTVIKPMKRTPRVHFSSILASAIPEKQQQQQQLSSDERKNLWYTREELTDSCREAKEIVKIIEDVDGDYAAIDHSKVCVVGLEKFHGKKERDSYRKLLVKAVLVRQDINRGMGIRGADCLCEVSTAISNSFREFALWQAAMHEFHANSIEPLQSKKRCSSDTVATQNPPKRQKKRRLGSDYDFSTITHTSSSQAEPADNGACNSSPNRVRGELQQMMAGFCS